MNIVAGLAWSDRFGIEAPARKQRRVHVQIAGPGDLGRGDADVAAGDQRQVVARHHRLARILEVHEVVFDLDVVR